MKKEFTAVIEQHEGINGAYVEIPFDVEEVFGSKRLKVRAMFDAREYRGSIVRMGGIYLIGMTQQIRKEIGKDFGDTVKVCVEKDEEERTVDLDPIFAAVMDQNEDARRFWESLSFTNKRRYAAWISSSKKEETRTERAIKAVQMLADQKKY